MPYKTKAERERENWMTLPEAVTHIRTADRCDKRAARRQLIAALADGLRVLGPLKWGRERDDRLPPFGSTSITTPTDTPPPGRAWLEAKIRWKAGRVRDDWGEYKPGKWRVLLILRHSVLRQWQPPGPTDSPARPDSASGNVVDILGAPKRGRRPERGNQIKDSMRNELREYRLTVQRLNDMKEEELVARFGGSRDTCRKARRAVLSESEFVENASKRIVDK